MFKYFNKSDLQLFAVERVISSRDSRLSLNHKCGYQPQEAADFKSSAALISIWISYQNSHTHLLFLRLLISDDAHF